MSTASVDRPQWRDRWLSWRNRLLGSAAFQRRAAAFPLTRPVARAHARELFDLCAGFVYSQVLLACVRLRLFELLANGPVNAAQLARQMGLSQEAAERLLAAAGSLRLVQRTRAGPYMLGPLGAAVIGNPAVAAMVEHHAVLYGDLHDPVALLRGEHTDTALGRYWGYSRNTHPAALTAAQVAAYSTLMSASQSLVAGEVLAAYPLRRHRCVLDLGGGEGTFLQAAAREAPALQLWMFDLPEVAERARTRLASAGLAHRARVFGGNFLADALPVGADLVTLVRVLHDHDDAAVARLLRAVHAALPAGGTVLLVEPMADTPGAEPMGEAYFGFYLLAMGQGRPRSAAQLIGMLRAAGFSAPRLLQTHMPLQTRLLSARRDA